jgi:ipoprotein LpqH
MNTTHAGVRRGATITLVGAAILAAALAGCSSNGAVRTLGQTISTSGHAEVVVAGQDQDVKGPVSCEKARGELQIGIGLPGASETVAVQATDANPPAIHRIALGTVNGVTLAYQQGSPGASVRATKDGNGYKFTGTATGVDKSNPMAGLVSEPFEVDVTCS